MKDLAVTVPLELILPEAVMWPEKVWVSAIASPNILEPLVNIIDDVTLEDEILLTVILANCTLSVVPKPKVDLAAAAFASSTSVAP